MRIAELFIVLMALSFLAHGQDRSKQGRDNPSPGASTSTRSAPPGKQDTKDINRSKPRKEEKDPDSRTRTKRKKSESDTEDARNSEDAIDRKSDQDSWDNGKVRDPHRRAVQTDHMQMFDKVRSGMNSGSVGLFSESLGPQVHVSLRGGESGYFSSSQAYYVLERYMQSNRISDLDFSTMEESGGTPFATGRTTLIKKGMKETAQVYVSLSQVGGRWVISQIKIY
ncbi:MAG: DUF4783 domain-containing protein [Ignavibacteria bacterium]|nr:DUF4783 domain-containing protein [Ignavibacteria bacterium]